MALYSDDIIAKVRLILDDPYPGIAATNEELNGWINTAQRTIAAAIPGTTAKHDNAFPLQAGTRQELPFGASRLLAVYGNRPNANRSDDEVAAVPIRLGNKKDIETNIPNWRGIERQSDCAFQYYLYDIDDPLNFYIYPSAQGPEDDDASKAELVEIVYSQAPKQVDWRNTGESGVYNKQAGTTDDVTVAQTELMIPDIYEDPIINYALYQAYSKPPHTAQRLGFANGRIQQFYNVVPAARQLDVESSPEADRDPERGA